MSIDWNDDTEFIAVEYREAANAYFKGVEIGWTGFRSYLTINALFAALIGALAESTGKLAGVSEVAKLIPFFALFASVAIVAVAPYYFRNLNNCRRRCEEIEKIKGGRLFTDLGAIATRGGGIRSMHVLLILVGSIVLFWCFVAMKSYYPDLVFVNVASTLKS
jgi:hypothetical protein